MKSGPLTFFRCPVAVPMKTTVKSPVEVAATAVSLVLKSNTGIAETGSSPPRGVLTSRPQKSSAMVCSFCNEKHRRLGTVSHGAPVYFNGYPRCDRGTTGNYSSGPPARVNRGYPADLRCVPWPGRWARPPAPLPRAGDTSGEETDRDPAGTQGCFARCAAHLKIDRQLIYSSATDFRG